MTIYKQWAGILVALLSLSLAGCSSTRYDFYVSPIGGASGYAKHSPTSLVGARDKVREISDKMKRDIIIHLHGGVYQLGEPFRLNEQDSGKNGHNIIYRADPGEAVVLSGGRTIKGWSNVRGTKIWTAAVDRNLQTRQFYVNGIRAVRATSKSGLSGTVQQTATGYVTTDTSMQAWKNPTDVEFVYTGAEGGSTPWTEVRCGVAAISGDGPSTRITMKQPCFTNIFKRGNAAVQNPTAIENAYELLDEPGEWYLDRAAGSLFYIPRTGEDMHTATAVVPILETLITGAGSPTHPIHNLTFYGITFAYAAWLQPSGNDGFVELQANNILVDDPMRGLMAPANVSFHTAKNIRFERNVFTHLGAQGLAFDLGSKSNVVCGNVFTDISGTAVRLGSVDAPKAPADLQDTDNRLSNNYIHDVCVEFHGGVGVFGGYLANTVIDHNEIANLPYTGISVGWGWGADSYARNNQISSNRVVSVMQILHDGGSVYTLSPQPNSRLTGNYFVNSKGNGIYHDEGTAFFTDRDNVAENIREHWFFLWTTSIHDNDIQSCWHSDDNGQNNGVNNIVANNTLVADKLWPPLAVRVIDNAGIQAAYRDIREK